MNILCCYFVKVSEDIHFLLHLEPRDEGNGDVWGGGDVFCDGPPEKNRTCESPPSLFIIEILGTTIDL